MILEWDWWAYVIIAITIFLSCALLNYIVNRINDAQLAQRLMLLYRKSPAGQVTQAEELTLGMDTAKSSSPIRRNQFNSITEIKIKDMKPNEIVISKVTEAPLRLGSVYKVPINVLDGDKLTEAIELPRISETIVIAEETDDYVSSISKPCDTNKNNPSLTEDNGELDDELNLNRTTASENITLLESQTLNEEMKSKLITSNESPIKVIEE